MVYQELFMNDDIRLTVSVGTATQVIEVTDDFEGSVIRVFRRLEELLRQLSQVNSVGNHGVDTVFFMTHFVDICIKIYNRFVAVS